MGSKTITKVPALSTERLAYGVGDILIAAVVGGLQTSTTYLKKFWGT
jgi:hypothetical protein